MHEISAPAPRFRLSPRLQLFLSLGLFSALLAALTASALLSLQRTRAAAHEAINVQSHLQQLAHQLATNTLLCRRYEKDFFLAIDTPTTRAEYFNKWGDAIAALEQTLASYAATATAPADRQQIGSWQQEIERYRGGFLQVRQAIEAGQITTPQAANRALEQFKDPIRIMTDSALEVAQRKAAAADEAGQRVLAISALGMRAILLTGILGLVIALLWSWIFMTRLVRPIAALQHGAQELARGNLAARVTIQRRDELGLLARSFNRMAETIQQRAADLEANNLALQQANQRQQALLDTVQALSAPLLPVWSGVVVLPIIGHLESQRAAALTTALLSGIQQQRARTAILDVTGLATVDAAVLGHLVQLVRMAELLGAQVLLAGLRPSTAQQIVAQDLDLGPTRTFRDLRSAIEAALIGASAPHVSPSA